MNIKKRNFYILFGAALTLFLIFASSSLKTRLSPSQENKSKPRVLTTVDIDRLFVFPAENQAGKEVDEISFTIASAKKTNEIAVKGRPIEAQEEKLFLVLDLEIENKTDEPLFLYPPDFVRLVGDEEKRFAPDFHNDVAKIEPISVKREQLGFIIPKEENVFALLVGELDEEKEQIEINF